MVTRNLARQAAGVVVSRGGYVRLMWSDITHNVASCRTGGLQCMAGGAPTMVEVQGGRVEANEDVDGREPDVAVVGECTVTGLLQDINRSAVYVSPGAMEGGASVLATMLKLAAAAGIHVPLPLLAQLQGEVYCGSSQQPCSLEEFAKALTSMTGERLGNGVSPGILQLRDGDLLSLQGGDVEHNLEAALTLARAPSLRCRALDMAGRQLSLESVTAPGSRAVLRVPTAWMQVGAGTDLILTGLTIRHNHVPDGGCRMGDATISVKDGGKLGLTACIVQSMAGQAEGWIGMRSGGALTIQTSTLSLSAPAIIASDVATRLDIQSSTLTSSPSLPSTPWLVVSSSAVVVVHSSTIDDMHIADSDGAFALVSGKNTVLDLHESTVQNVSARDGGAIMALEGASVGIYHCAGQNVMASGTGGLLHLGREAKGRVHGSTCHQCEAVRGGAYVYVGTLARSTLDGITAVESVGSAVYVDAIGSSAIRGFVCRSGSAERGACLYGAMYDAITVMDSVFHIARTTATLPTAVGGALVSLEQARASAVTVFVNCTWMGGWMVPSTDQWRGGDDGFVGGG